MPQKPDPQEHTHNLDPLFENVLKRFKTLRVRRSPVLRQNGSSKKFTEAAEPLVKPCLDGSFGKCDCGATMKTQMDARLHYCHPVATARTKQIVRWDMPWD